MERKPFAGASKAALNFIRDQKGSSFGRQSSCRPIEFLGNRPHTAFPLKRFNQYRAYIVGQLSFEILNIVELHEFKAWHQGFEWLPVFRRGRGRQRAKRPSVKGILHRKNPEFSLAARIARPASPGA